MEDKQKDSGILQGATHKITCLECDCVYSKDEAGYLRDLTVDVWLGKTSFSGEVKVCPECGLSYTPLCG